MYMYEYLARLGRPTVVRYYRYVVDLESVSRVESTYRYNVDLHTT